MCKGSLIHHQHCGVAAELLGNATTRQVQRCACLNAAFPVAHCNFTRDAKLLSSFNEGAWGDIPDSRTAQPAHSRSASAAHTTSGHSCTPGRPAHSRCAAAYRTSCSDDTAGVLQLGTVHTCGRHTEQLPHGGAAAVLAHCLLKETDCLLKTHCRPAHLKSPHTFKLSWLPFSMYTAPPCLRACLSRSLNRRTMPAQIRRQPAGTIGGVGACRSRKPCISNCRHLVEQRLVCDLTQARD